MKIKFSPDDPGVDLSPAQMIAERERLAQRLSELQSRGITSMNDPAYRQVIRENQGQQSKKSK